MKKYWIRGHAKRGGEIIKMLKNLGGKNPNALDGYNEHCIYYIDNDNIIDSLRSNSVIALALMWSGEELKLLENESEILCTECTEWGKCERRAIYTGAWYDQGFVKRNFDSLISSDLFVTKQQSKSAQAAAMISQIREQDKDIYGEIVTKGIPAYIITGGTNRIIVIERVLLCIEGGLLRFGTKEQAKLFLDNNRELVEEYLKTF